MVHDWICAIGVFIFYVFIRQMVVLPLSENQFYETVQREQEFLEETKSMKNIYSAFIKAQKEFAPALKTSTNPHFRSKYVALDGCIEAVLDALNNNDIGLLQVTHDSDTGVMVETVLIHSSGEQMSGGKLFVPATKLDAQGFGSALTYARRYSLMATCGIAPEDDDGNAASKPINNIDTTPMVNAIKQAQTMDDLQRIFKDVWSNVKGNPKAEKEVTLAKEQMKAELTK